MGAISVIVKLRNLREGSFEALVAYRNLGRFTATASPASWPLLLPSIHDVSREINLASRRAVMSGVSQVARDTSSS